MGSRSRTAAMVARMAEVAGDGDAAKNVLSMVLWRWVRVPKLAAAIGISPF